ncbi:uncharacterized protein [Amphiura filiformis]|uniref:uncharacterized protein n=1 Tax=Amphiura filiformis TaxID=82378 RepID=UPI003B21E6F4
MAGVTMDGTGGKAVEVEDVPDLVKLPPELIQRIGTLCNIKSLGRLCMTCKVLNFVLSDEIVWKQQWQQICRHHNLMGSSLDLSKTTYRDACIRSAICLFDGIFQNDVEAMTGTAGLGWSHVRNAMAFDCGSKTASIAWLFDYFRSSCPAITAHLKVSCTCNWPQSCGDATQNCAHRSLNLDQLNEKLKSSGHPRLYRPVVVGQKAKLLLGQFPDMYQREEYPIYYTRQSSKKVQAQGQHCARSSRWDGDQHPACSSALCSKFPTSVSGSLGSLSSFSSSSTTVPKTFSDASSASADFEQSWSPSGHFTTRKHSTHTNCNIHEENKCEVYFQVSNPVKDGDIVNLTDYELLLRHLHGSVTGGSQQLSHMRDICRTAFLLCEPPRCSHKTRKDLLKLMFEKLKVSRICLQNKAGLLPMDSSFSTCLVIDSGARSTVVTPIISSRIQQDAVQFKPIGGLQVSLALADTITCKGLVNEVFVDSLDDRGVKEECWLAYQPSFEIRKKYATKNILVPRPRDKGSFSSIPFGSERYLACEDMYCNLDLTTMVAKALDHCEHTAHRPLLSRIILTGGNGALKGFA